SFLSRRGESITSFIAHAPRCYPVTERAPGDGYDVATGVAAIRVLAAGQAIGPYLVAMEPKLLCSGPGHDLEQHVRLHRELAGEGPAVRRDQDHRYPRSGREDRENDAVGRPVVAMDHADRDQRECRLHHQRRPFYPVDRGVAQNDALAARVERVLD